MLSTLIKRSFAIRWSKYPVPGMAKEYKDYKTALAETRKKLKAEYEEIQTKAEEQWLDQYTKEQQTKWIRDMDKWRTSVCRIAMHTKKQMEFLQTRDIQQAARNKLNAAKFAQESFERRLMLDAMEIEATKWPTQKNAEKVMTEVSFPPQVIDNQEYLERLRNVMIFRICHNLYQTINAHRLQQWLTGGIMKAWKST